MYNKEYTYYPYIFSILKSITYSLNTLVMYIMQLQLSVILLRIFNLDLDLLWTSDECHTYLRNLHGLFFI